LTYHQPIICSSSFESHTTDRGPCLITVANY
jgi:hypothetical protein